MESRVKSKSTQTISGESQQDSSAALSKTREVDGDLLDWRHNSIIILIIILAS